MDEHALSVAGADAVAAVAVAAVAVVAVAVVAVTGVIGETVTEPIPTVTDESVVAMSTMAGFEEVVIIFLAPPAILLAHPSSPIL